METNRKLILTFLLCMLFLVMLVFVYEWAAPKTTFANDFSDWTFSSNGISGNRFTGEIMGTNETELYLYGKIYGYYYWPCWWIPDGWGQHTYESQYPIERVSFDASIHIFVWPKLWYYYGPCRLDVINDTGGIVYSKSLVSTNNQPANWSGSESIVLDTPSKNITFRLTVGQEGAVTSISEVNATVDNVALTYVSVPLYRLEVLGLPLLVWLAGVVATGVSVYAFRKELRLVK